SVAFRDDGSDDGAGERGGSRIGFDIGQVPLEDRRRGPLPELRLEDGRQRQASSRTQRADAIRSRPRRCARGLGVAPVRVHGRPAIPAASTWWTVASPSSEVVLTPGDCLVRSAAIGASRSAISSGTRVRAVVAATSTAYEIIRRRARPWVMITAP